jgi:hypothetical protein
MGFVDRPEDEDIAPKPRMKPIQEFSADDPVGVLNPRCTIQDGLTRR